MSPRKRPAPLHLTACTPSANRYRVGVAEKTVPLYVRLTPDQHAKLERIAKAKDRSLAWVVRNMIDRVQEK